MAATEAVIARMRELEMRKLDALPQPLREAIKTAPVAVSVSFAANAYESTGSIEMALVSIAELIQRRLEQDQL